MQLTPAGTTMELDRNSRFFLAQENILHQFVHSYCSSLFNLLAQLEGVIPFNAITESIRTEMTWPKRESDGGLAVDNR